MKSVLFVDDDASVLSGLRRMLHPLRAEWNMRFANSGQEALTALTQAPADVVVSDMRMPGMDGIEFLTAVKARMPEAVRIILSGHADREFILRSVGLAHQFLTKPCNPEELKATVKRALALRALLSSERLAAITARMTALPPMPALYLEIQRALADQATSIEDVGRIVAKDIAMSAKVMQLVNSAFFGVAQPLGSVVDATVYLGLDTITALVLTSQVFGRESPFRPETHERLWAHSLRSGRLARAILRMEGFDENTAEQGFLAGLLHDVGILVLAAELRIDLARAWKHARRFGVPPQEAERRMIGASHATIGAYLMGIWGLPDAVIEAIALHHTPAAATTEGMSVVTAVHVASVLDCAALGSVLGESEHELDLAHLARHGLEERLPLWRAEAGRVFEEKAA